MEGKMSLSAQGGRVLFLGFPSSQKGQSAKCYIALPRKDAGRWRNVWRKARAWNCVWITGWQN
ncbi:hypothetical protein WSS15_16450 [Acetobacter pasteurianus]|nr:hypothetical protein WSS15_16450 [Acetobacter pasteurianus]